MFQWGNLIVFSFWTSKDRSLDTRGSILVVLVLWGWILDGWRINPWCLEPKKYASSNGSSSRKTSKLQYWPKNGSFFSKKAFHTLTNFPRMSPKQPRTLDSSWIYLILSNSLSTPFSINTLSFSFSNFSSFPSLSNFHTQNTQ